MVVCGIASIIGAGIMYYLTNLKIFQPLETPDSEWWVPLYILTIGFGGLGLFLTGIFKKR
jgi:hypothetical protein